MRGSLERRVSELERRRGKRDVRFIWLDPGHPREEHERLRAEAEAEVGPGGLIIEIPWPITWRQERGKDGNAQHR